MSYDLAAFPREGKHLPSFDEFQEFFRARKHYEVEDNTAFYDNEETETYFCWAYETEAADFEALGITVEEFDEVPEDGLPDLDFPLICININYGYSDAAREEIKSELEAFWKHFDLLVEDPQVDGMGRGEFTGAGFLKSYNAGNQLVRGW